MSRPVRRILAAVMAVVMLAGLGWMIYLGLRADRRKYIECVDACLQEHVCQSRWACSKTCDNN